MVVVFVGVVRNVITAHGVHTFGKSVTRNLQPKTNIVNKSFQLHCWTPKLIALDWIVKEKWRIGWLGNCKWVRGIRRIEMYSIQFPYCLWQYIGSHLLWLSIFKLYVGVSLCSGESINILLQKSILLGTVIYLYLHLCISWNLRWKFINWQFVMYVGTLHGVI